MAKCPVCGAPMESKSCGYCGYQEREAPQPQMPGGNKSEAVPQQATYDQEMQSQTVQPWPVNPGAEQPIQFQQGMPMPGLANGYINPGVSRKSKTTALLLCLFLGEFGVHRFYVGRVEMGFVYLFTCGLFGIGWLVDLILIATGRFRDEFYLPLKN